MKLKQKWKRIIGFLICIAMALTMTVFADCIVVLMERSLSITAFCVIGVCFVTVCCLLCHFLGDRTIKIMVVLLGLVILGCTGMYCLWNQFGERTQYRSIDSGKEHLFAGHKVMLIVPHQDDDINVLGGTVEEFVSYGSQVQVVFLTNGDYYDMAELRFQEAIEACNFMGIPKENITFLGYGDQWKDEGSHIYNALPGVVMESANGRTQTYGTVAAPAYREGRAYTFENMLEDLKQVILDSRPDILICSDYDRHIDHKALSLLFDKVMGQILKEETDYRPIVLKGFAYLSAWYAPFDFYDVNIRSTRDVFGAPNYQYPRVYRWEDRVRLPVAAATLSRSLLHSKAYATLCHYASQDAGLHAAGIVNGDKVFWERNTKSLCYTANVETSSGNDKFLNDFMILENYDLANGEHDPFDGTWIPVESDALRSATVTFTQPESVESIVLYDHPSEKDNVLQARIRFDDGSELLTGPLDVDGAATKICVRKKQVQSFAVILEDTEGSNAGLTELEAIPETEETVFTFLKLTDEAGNFVYDYWTESDGSAVFSLYTGAELRTGNIEDYMITWENTDCQVNWSDGKVNVICPVGDGTVLQITDVTGQMSDSIYIQNPGWLERMQCSIFQKLEEVLFVGYCKERHRELATVKLLDLAGKILGIR